MNVANTGAPSVRQQREVVAYANQFVTVFDDDVEFSDGQPGKFLRIAHARKGLGVVILPMRSGSIGLVRTYRYPIGEWQWGLPRGFSKSADPKVTARDELLEELGVRAAELLHLGLITPDSGLLASRVAVMHARIEADTQLRPVDTDEVAEARWVTAAQVWRMIADGELQDGMTLSAMSLAKAAGINIG